MWKMLNSNMSCSKETIVSILCSSKRLSHVSQRKKLILAGQLLGSLTSKHTMRPAAAAKVAW